MNENRLSTINTVAAVIIAPVTIFGGALLVYKTVDDTYARKNNPKIDLLVHDYKQKLETLTLENEERVQSISEEYRQNLSDVVSQLQKKAEEKEAELVSVIDNGKIQMDKSIISARTDTSAIRSMQTDASDIVDELKNEKQNVIRVTGTSKNGPNEGADTGVLKSRRLSFEKMEPTSVIKVTYTDVFRVKAIAAQPLNQACQWKVKIGDDICEDTPIVTDRHDGKSSDVHSAGVISGYCRSVPVGNHEITVEVMPRPHKNAYKTADCYTGWNLSTWSIEVTEYRQLY